MTAVGGVRSADGCKGDVVVQTSHVSNDVRVSVAIVGRGS